MIFQKESKKHAKHLQTSFLPQEEIFLTGRQRVFFPDIYIYLPTALQKQIHPILFFSRTTWLLPGSTPPNNKNKHLITVLYRNLSDVFCLLNKCRVTVAGYGKNTSQHGSSWRRFFFKWILNVNRHWELFKIFGAAGWQLFFLAAGPRGCWMDDA